MNERYQIPRFSLAWLLLALISLIIPHVLRMPVWLVGLCSLCIAGRILIFQGRISYPRAIVKVIIVLLMVVGLVINYGRDIFSTDATVAILIASITLKLLEMQRKRDVLLVLYLCYFAVIAEFIYSQSILVALYMSVCVLLITSALMSLNQSQKHQQPRRTFKLSAVILLQSIPMMLAMFILFPRMSPLWSVPIQSNSGVTGLSDNMSPGDIGELVGSAEVAFRVEFEGDVPPNSQLYWRAITLDSFDGREWQRGFNLQPQFLGANPNSIQNWFESIEYQGNVVNYNVIMEPTFNNWIYTLKIPSIQDERFIMRRDFQVDAIRRIGQRFTYAASSYLENRLDNTLTSRQQRRALGLPNDGNERSREFALNLREQMGSDRAYIQAILTYFREQAFFYTLSPSLLGDNVIDDFLFSTLEGFCEHYASTFTFLMRAAGIPARVVTGYQGGELNPYDGTLTVRQYDAHAWSEVWIDGSGWVRFDPTAAVAPERISLGSQLSLQEEESFLEDAGFSMLKFRNLQLLNDLRLRLEMIDYRWNRFVLNYDEAIQFAFFSRLFSSVTKQKIVLTMLGCLFLFFSIMILVVLKKPSKPGQHPATKVYLGYCKLLAKKGFERRNGETPSHYYQRLSEQRPQWAAAMEKITKAYIEIIYQTTNSSSYNGDKIKQLKTLVRKFRLTT